MFRFVSVSRHNIVHVVSNNTPGVAIANGYSRGVITYNMDKIRKGRLRQRGRGTDAETVISECSDEVNLVISRCE